MTTQPFYWAAKEGWFLWVRDAAGKRKRVFLAKTKKAAWIIWKDRLAAGREETGNPRFSEVATQWLARQQIRRDRAEVSQGWLNRVTRTLDAFNKANPGLRCSSLIPSVATGWLGNCSAAYEHTEVNVLKQVLKWAVQQGLIARSPLDGMPLSKGKRREAVFSIDDHRALVREANEQVRWLLWAAWYTGCRPIELRSLDWGQLNHDCSMAILTEHKNARSTDKPRVIYFHPNLQAILVRHRKKSGPVFLNSQGRPWKKDALVSQFNRLRKKAKVSGTAYAYRHSYATRALEQGVLPADLAEILGTSVEMIARNYSHLDQSKLRLAGIAGKVR